MSAAPTASIQRWTWKHGTEHTPGVMIRCNGRQVFVPKDQLATFADYMIDAFEEAT